MDNKLELEVSPFTSFTMAIRSPITRQKYLQRLSYFIYFLGIDEGNTEQSCNTLGQKARADSKWLTNNVIRYLQVHRQRMDRREISAATLRNYLKPIKLFCEQLEISLPLKRITRGIPRGRRYANDRVPTFEEIQKIIAYPDRRIKPIVYVMASSGIRLGAWNYLKWKDVVPIMKDGKIVAARLRVYAEEEEEYFTFISLEAWNELSDWMKYRETCGEEITGESWIMRNLWDVTTPRGKGVVTIPKQLRPDGIKRLMERALWAQGVRKNLTKNKSRHEFQVNHSYRKWFKTRCELGGMRSIIIEELLCHSTGISDHYFRPNEQELEQAYLQCIDYLTINEENRLKKKVHELTEKENDNKYLIKFKLEERYKEIELLKENDSIMSDAVTQLSDQLIKMRREIQEMKESMRIK
jgi:integrase